MLTDEQYAATVRELMPDLAEGLIKARADSAEMGRLIADAETRIGRHPENAQIGDRYVVLASTASKSDGQ